MLVGLNVKSCNDFGIDATLLEPDSNTEASSYITDNYQHLIKTIKSLGIKEEKAHDLLHDVFISICEAEEDGRGYDIDYGEKNGGTSLILVEQFVIGRIKGYANNPKYRTDVMDTGSTSYTVTTYYEEPVVDRKGYVRDKNGNIVTQRKCDRKRVSMPATVCAASYNQGKDVDEINDSFQKAYAMATASDSIDDIAEFYSLKEQIDYCIDVCELHNVNILNVFKNLDMLADMLGDYSKKRKNAESVFAKLSELATYHTEFGMALTNILSYSSTNRGNFDLVLAAY